MAVEQSKQSSTSQPRILLCTFKRVTEMIHLRRIVLDENNAARAEMLRQSNQQSMEDYIQKRQQQTSSMRTSVDWQRWIVKTWSCCEILKFNRKTQRIPQRLRAVSPNEQRDGSILSDDCKVIERWKQYYDKYLNRAEGTG